MRKLFVKSVRGEQITFTGDDHKHIAYSLRMRRGDELTVCADGVDYTAKITNITKDSTTADIVGKARCVAEPSVQLALFFGAMKGDRNDYVVQKCTELGVTRFIPFMSDFSSVNVESIKTERLNRIALEAAKQSGRGIVPEVAETIRFNDLLDLVKDYDAVIFPYEHEEEMPLNEFMSSLSGERIAVVIGSEGGFSKKEASALSEISGASVTLGERILRADTACVAVTSVVMYALGEWRRSK